MSFDFDSLEIGEPPQRLPNVAALKSLIGNTPMLRLTRLSSSERPIYLKLENTNPSGSIRDRYVAEIVELAMSAGQVMTGDTIVLAGINDSAVSASWIGASLGLKVRVFAPKDSTPRLVPFIEKFGGTIEWCPEDTPLPVCVESAAAFARQAPDRVYVDGYRREAVTEAYQTIGHEILESLIDTPLGGFVTSVTTGATFREVSRKLRASHPQLEVRGARIIENEFATAEENPRIEQFKLKDIWKIRDEIAENEGVLLGPKGAACIRLAIELSEELPGNGAIVALNPDSGQRYVGWEDKILFRT